MAQRDRRDASRPRDESTPLRPGTYKSTFDVHHSARAVRTGTRHGASPVARARATRRASSSHIHMFAVRYPGDRSDAVASSKGIAVYNISTLSSHTHRIAVTKRSALYRPEGIVLDFYRRARSAPMAAAPPPCAGRCEPLSCSSTSCRVAARSPIFTSALSA